MISCIKSSNSNVFFIPRDSLYFVLKVAESKCQKSPKKTHTLEIPNVSAIRRAKYPLAYQVRLLGWKFSSNTLIRTNPARIFFAFLLLSCAGKAAERPTYPEIGVSAFWGSSSTSSNINTTDYQYITNYMVQIWFVIKPIIQTLLLNTSIYVTQFMI